MNSFNIARARSVFLSQVNEFKRDFGAIFLGFAFPLFFVVVLVASNLVRSAPTVEFGLVPGGSSQQEAAFAEALASDNILFRTMDRESALQALNGGKVQAVVVFPGATGSAAGDRLELISDEQFAPFGAIIMDSARARLVLGDRDGAFAFETSTITRQGDAQFSFIYPGMLAMALLQLGLFLTATPLLRARERGTLRYLLLTPLSMAEMIVGQVGFRLVVAFCQVVILLIAGSFIIPLDVLSWLAVLGVAMLGVAMLVCIGYALAGVAPSADSGSIMIMIVNFGMMFGGNIFWNPEGSTALLIVAHIIPASYLADLFRQIITGADGLWPVWVNLAALLVWTGAALAVAATTFRFDMRRGESRPVAAARR